MNKVFLLFSIFLLGSSVSAFVENTTHGYPNCMTCHVAPTGGGILTEYGRALSSELMSTIKTKDFQKPFYGLGKNTKHVKWGGDFRTIQTRIENDQIKRGSQFTMQNNVETALYVKDFVFAGTVGVQGGPDSTENKDDFISERHFMMWNIDQTTRVRVGKFRQAFGLYDPNHARLNKQNLGFGSNSETYQLEVFKFFENGEAVLSTSLGRMDIPSSTREKNFMARYTNYLGGKSRLSGSVLIGESPSERRSVYAISGVFPIMDKSNILRFEVDYQVTSNLNQQPKGDKTQSTYGNVLFGKKVIDGVFPYFIYEYGYGNLDAGKSTFTSSPGIGLQFLPIAHVELQIEHQYRKSYSTPDNPTHTTFAVLHLYH